MGPAWYPGVPAWYPGVPAWYPGVPEDIISHLLTSSGCIRIYYGWSLIRPDQTHSHCGQRQANSGRLLPPRVQIMADCDPCYIGLRTPTAASHGGQWVDLP